MNKILSTTKAFAKNNLIALLFLLLSLLLTYNYTDFSSNMSIGVGHVYMSKSLVLSRNFNVTEYWGNAGVDVFELNDEYYAAYAPLNSVIMAVPYFILQVVYYIYTNFIGSINGDLSLVLESWAFSLPSALSPFILAVFLRKYLLSKKISSRLINIAIFSLLFGTIFFNYSISFFNHVHSALLLFLAFFILSNKRTTSKRDYLFSGVLVGLSFLNENPTILFSLGVLSRELYIISKQKISKKLFVNSFTNLFVYALPVALSIIILLIYNKFNFGGYFTFAEDLVREYRNSKYNIPSEVGTFTQNPLYGIFGLYFSPLKGLFVYSPFLIFSVLGLKEFYNSSRREFFLIVPYMFIISVLYALWVDCFGASSLGARYLITLIPFYVILSVLALLKNKRLVPSFIFLMVISSVYLFINVLDGLPNRMFLNCEQYLYYPATYIKAHLYIQDLFSGKLGSAPVLIQYITK